MSLLPKDSLSSLEHEYGIIRLIHHRNRNQHRVTSWWKHLNSLKRNLTKLISLLHTYFRKANDKIRHKVLEVARHLYLHVSKAAYRAFNGIIALGQFIPLGLTLVGTLGKVYHEVGKIEGLKDIRVQRFNGAPLENSDNLGIDGEDLGADLGEEVVVDEIPDMKKRKSFDNAEFVVKKKKKTEGTKLKNDSTRVGEKKKKKKKSKSAIDDIFG